MFKCENCNCQTKPGQKVNKVYKQKPREYRNVRVVYEEVQGRNVKKEEVYFTQGWEIEKEFDYCLDCYKEA